MKNLIMCIRICRQEWLRLLCGWKFYISVIAYFGICIMLLYSDSPMVFKYATVEEGMDLLSGLSNFNKLLVLVASFPFAASFSDDWSERYMNHVIIRGNRGGYILSKLIMGVITSFVISIAGLVCFCIFNMVRNGITRPDLIIPDAVHYRERFVYVMIEVLGFSMVSSVYAVIGIAVSAVIPNRFVAITAPIFVNTFLEQIMKFFPNSLDLFKIQRGYFYNYFGAVGTLAMSVMVCTGYIIIAGMVFASFARRRIQNEII